MTTTSTPNTIEEDLINLAGDPVDLNLPSLLDAFDLEAELEEAKAGLVLYSFGLYTDTSNADPGVALVRVILEKIEELLFRLSARYSPDALLLHLGSLGLVAPLEPTKSVGQVRVVYGPNTTISAGFQVVNDATGEAYALAADFSGGAQPGAVNLAFESVGTGASTRAEAGAVTTVRSAAATGSVTSVVNVTPFEGGRDAETLAEYRRRMPSALGNRVLFRLNQFEAAALEDGRVGRARALRGKRPTATPGVFETRAGSVTLVVLGPGGGVLDPLVLAQLQAMLLERTYFAITDDDPTRAGVQVVNARVRAVDVELDVYAADQADLKAVASSVTAAIQAFLNPITGGQKGEGTSFARAIRKSELIWAVEQLRAEGVSYVDADSVLLYNNDSFAPDEIAGPGQVTVRVAYDPGDG